MAAFEGVVGRFKAAAILVISFVGQNERKGKDAIVQQVQLLGSECLHLFP